jgi:hypothetical protein
LFIFFWLWLHIASYLVSGVSEKYGASFMWAELKTETLSSSRNPAAQKRSLYYDLEDHTGINPYPTNVENRVSS